VCQWAVVFLKWCVNCLDVSKCYYCSKHGCYIKWNEMKWNEKVTHVRFLMDAVVPRQDFQCFVFRVLIIISQKLNNYSYISLWADIIGSSQTKAWRNSYRTPATVIDYGQYEHVACHVMFLLFVRLCTSLKWKYFPSTWHIFKYLVLYFSQNNESGFASTNNTEI
jgi:hypothetical protein